MTNLIFPLKLITITPSWIPQIFNGMNSTPLKIVSSLDKWEEHVVQEICRFKFNHFHVFKGCYVNSYCLFIDQNMKTIVTHESQTEEANFKVGRYSAEERKEKISKYRAKRSQRKFNKIIKVNKNRIIINLYLSKCGCFYCLNCVVWLQYACRKTLADNRTRIRGRFARNDETNDIPKPQSSKIDEYQQEFWVRFYILDLNLHYYLLECVDDISVVFFIQVDLIEGLNDEYLLWI